MRIIVNGKNASTKDGASISSVLNEMHIQSKVVAVSLNLDVVKKEKWNDTILKENDSLELLHFMGGGRNEAVSGDKVVKGFDTSDLAIEESIKSTAQHQKKTLKQEVKDHIRVVENFPKPGISFKDITTFINNQKIFSRYIEALAERYTNYGIEYIAAIEARGFIIGSALAFRLKAGFAPIRKKGKLPHSTISEKYQLEYGSEEMHIHEDAFHGIKGVRVLLVDDVIATGGTANAAVKLLNRMEVKCVELCTLINLKAMEDYEDRKEIQGSVSMFSLVEYER